MFTKHLSRADVDRCMEMMNLHFLTGRSASAPKIVAQSVEKATSEDEHDETSCVSKQECVDLSDESIGEEKNAGTASEEEDDAEILSEEEEGGDEEDVEEKANNKSDAEVVSSHDEDEGPAINIDFGLESFGATIQDPGNCVAIHRPVAHDLKGVSYFLVLIKGLDNM